VIDAAPVQQALVGRDEQRAQVQAWLTERITHAADAPAAVFISGEAGIGKTALAQASLPADVAVRQAVAAAWHPRPFGLLDQLVPSLGRAGAGGHLDAQDIRAAVVNSGEPSVLLLEDVHWSDEASLDLLVPVIESLADDAVAVLLTYRSEELPRQHLLRRVRAHLRRGGRLAEITLGPLPPIVLPELIESLVGRAPTPALVAAVAERTDGVPFFVGELLAAVAAAGWLTTDGNLVGLAAGGDLPLPESVRDAVLLRAASLHQQARDALDVAAVAGGDFDLAVVTALTGGTWPPELDECGLVTPGPAAERRFRHALTHEALYSDIPWSRRRELHLAVAERIAARGGPATSVARHLLAGRDLDRARPVLVAAAEEHAGAHAYRDAARLLQLALDAWPSGVEEARRLAVVDRLAQCAELTGEHAAAITNLRELADHPGTDGAPAAVHRAESHRRLAVQYELLGQWPLALAARETAAVAFTVAERPADSAQEYLAVAAHLRSAASFRAALDVLALAHASAAAAGRADLGCRIAGLRGNVLARMGRASEGVPAVQAALDEALTSGLTAPAAEIFQRLADSLEHAGDYRGADSAYRSAYEFCSRHEQDAAAQLCRACATVVLFQGGRWERAATLCAEVLRDPAATAHARAVASGVDGLILAMRGRTAAARAALLDSRSTAVRIDLVAMELLSTWGLALLDEAAGESERAADNYRHVLARCRATEERHYCVPILQFAVARFAVDGAVADLGAATALLADAVSKTGQPEARAAFAYALGESALAERGAEQATAHLLRAVGLLDGLDLPVADTLMRHRTGVTLAATGDSTAAAALLADAHRTARRLKARLLVDRIRPDLERVGGAPAGPGRAQFLTGRELQVLRLVAEGLTNREIGKRLYLSVRTVEMHVANATAKLGCRTRAEAVARLGP
jgi:DNA-binding CsgD family transcriptional regulator